MPVSPVELQAALQDQLRVLTHSEVRVENLAMLAGGASQEMWRLDLNVAEGERQGDYKLVLRRQLGGKIYPDALDLWQEFRVMQVAYASDVLLPYPQAYMPDLLGRPAVLVHRLQGETIGRRIVREPTLARARQVLPAQLGKMLARIHRIDLQQYDLRSLVPHPTSITPAQWIIAQLERNLDDLGEPHPALELGIRWLRQHEPAPPERLTFLHGDYRLGNLMVNSAGLVGVLDWEFAHIGDAYEDLAWSLVRDWRFGSDQLHFAGIAQPDAFFAAYERAVDTTIDVARVRYWEIMGNVRWAVGMLNQAQRHLRGIEPNLEFASLGRRCAEVELEVLRLIR